MISVVVQLTKYAYNPISHAKLANRIFLEAICLSKAHDYITKSIMSPLKVWLVASNSWVCFFSSLRSFWVLSILHLILSPSSLMALKAASLAESKNVVCIIVLVTMQNPESLWLSSLFLYKLSCTHQYSNLAIMSVFINWIGLSFTCKFSYNESLILSYLT